MESYASDVSYALGSHRIAVSVRWVGCIVGVGCVGVTGGGCGELYVSYVSYVPRIILPRSGIAPVRAGSAGVTPIELGFKTVKGMIATRAYRATF